MPDTFMFNVKYAVAGGVESRTIEARSEDEARSYAQVPRHLVLSVGRNYLAEVERLLPKAGPSIEIQARILAVFAAQVVSGADRPGEIFDRSIAGYPTLRAKLEEVRKVQKISEKMTILKFDPNLQLLAEVGESSGMLGEVLGNAAEEVIERQRVLGEIKMKVYPAVAIALFGLLTMLVMPIFMVDPLEETLNSKGIKVNVNVCTDMMMAIGKTFSHWEAWLILLGSLIGLGITAPKWWPFVKTYPGFSFVENFIRVQNAYKFTSAFLPLFSRGVNLLKSVEMIEKFATGSSKKAYRAMLTHLTTGGEISNAFEGDFWDPQLRDCMRGFGPMRQDAKINLLKQIKPLMAQTVAKYGNRVATIVSGIGLFLAVAVTVIIFIGLNLPLMTLSATY